MYKPGDLVTEVVVWEVVEYDDQKKIYKCKERKGNRTRLFAADEVGPAGAALTPIDVKSV
jgi:hypothetical protein